MCGFKKTSRTVWDHRRSADDKVTAVGNVLLHLLLVATIDTFRVFVSKGLSVSVLIIVVFVSFSNVRVVINRAN